jgi:protein-S-isoprenylcysteine O-methyltransferase Ste14
MRVRAFFVVLLVGFAASLATKISLQRRALGRSPVVLGKAPAPPLARWFERLGPVGLLCWPAAWLWIAFGDAPLRPDPAPLAGMGIMAIGGVLSLVSIFAMGRAWRIGIDPDNRTELAAGGPYRWIRHPIYGGMLIVMIGNVIVVDSRAIAVMTLLTAVGIAYQAGREEQYLHRTFGERYARYAARTGRFAPRLGALFRPGR